MIDKKYEQEHVFQWVAVYHNGDPEITHSLYQFDESSEYFVEEYQEIPMSNFKKVVLDGLEKEGRLHSLHLIPRGKLLEETTLPRYSVYPNGDFEINGQLFIQFHEATKNVKLKNHRLIFYFSPVVQYHDKDGAPDFDNPINTYIRKYVLGIQANDVKSGKNYSMMMEWIRDREGVKFTAKDRRGGKDSNNF